MWDDLIRWGSLGLATLAGAFGYGALHQRVQALEVANKEESVKIDKLLELVSDIRERLARLEGR